MDYLGMVREFHNRFACGINEEPTLVSKDKGKLRLQLIFEEMWEFRDGIINKDIVEIADAIGDLLYVTFGAAVTYGIPIERVFEEIHRSNLSKLPEDGIVKYREDGKVLKPDTFSPPNLSFIKEKSPARLGESDGAQQEKGQGLE